MVLKSWEVDLITAQADASTWQAVMMVEEELDRYQARLIEMVRRGKAFTVPYEDLETVYWVHSLNDYVAEMHVFSTGAIWKLVESFRRFKQDVWSKCLHMRVEFRVRKPVLQAIVKRCGVPIEGVRRKAWYDSTTCRMIDENLYALHRPQSLPESPVSTQALASFTNGVVNLATALVAEFDLLTLPVRHFFQDGMYIRELTIPKGTCVIGYQQNHDHVCIVSGDLSVRSAAGLQRYMGPHNTFKSSSGVQRVGYAHQDTIFTTVHKMANPGERDLKKLEAEFFSGSYEEFLNMQLTQDSSRELLCQAD